MGKNGTNAGFGRLNCSEVYRVRPGWRRTALVLALFVLVLPICCPARVRATTEEELERALKEQEETAKRKQENEGRLNALQGMGEELAGKLNNLNAELTLAGETLDDLAKQQTAKEQEIATAEQELIEAQETEAWQYACMVHRVRDIYLLGHRSVIETFTDGFNNAVGLKADDYARAVSDYDEQMRSDYEQTRKLIEIKKADLIREREELAKLHAQAEEEQSRVATLVSETSESVADNADAVSRAEADALEYESRLAEQEADIEVLRKKIEEEKRLAALAAQAAWRDISEVTFAAGDRDLLAAIIYCEAGNQPYAGQLAVGAVVINRMLSSRYPDTMVGVIYQPYQFSPVRSGRLDLALTGHKATKACYNAADEAMTGASNVGNCLYFRTPIEGLTGIAIGGHIFY